MSVSDFVVKGLFIDTPAVGSLRIRKGYAVCRNGLFAGFYKTLPQDLAQLPLKDYGDRLILPGFVDLHLHAPQFNYCGLGMDVQLLEWLQKYTYPEEARYNDPSYALQSYSRFTQALASTATTRACIFGSLSTDSTLLLMQLLEEAGLCCYVGKLNMNRNAPDFYCESSTEEGMKETRRWLDGCRSFKRSKPMITPRFTPSVTDDYMKALGELVREQHLPVQSHLDESESEIAWIRELCPDCIDYAETYDRYGMFGDPHTENGCVMAHCIFCNEREKQLMKANHVTIAHCPTSNSNVVAGMAPAAEYLRGGWQIGLGSDIAGGHTLNLFEVMRAAIQISKLRWLQIDRTLAPLTVPETLYMATAGGGRFFTDTPVGLFESGYAFDAVVLQDTELRLPAFDTPAERLERYVYMGSGKPIAKYVQGLAVLEG